MYTCDPLLEFEVLCSTDGQICIDVNNLPKNSELIKNFERFRLQTGGCFYLSNVQKYLRAINPRSLASAQFWNPLIEARTDATYGTVFLQRKDLLDSPKSEISRKILNSPDLGGIDGIAQFGGDFVVNESNGALFATAAGVAFGQG